MERKIVSLNLIIRYLSGSLNPTDINEQFLINTGIVDENNKLDKGMLRIGSLGTNIVFLNESEDEIKVQASSLEISSKDKERLELIVKHIKKEFDKISLISATFEIDEHFDDEDYPNIVFDNFVKSDLILDVIRYKKGKYSFTVYSCAPKRIHVKTTYQQRLNIQFSDFSFGKNLSTADLDKSYSDLLTKDLKILEPT